MEETLLSLDLSFTDAYYRIRRSSEHDDRVVYVFVKDLDILPEDCQTYGPDIIKTLRKSVDCWHEEWSTLTIWRESGSIASAKDQWQRDYLPQSAILSTLPRVSVLSLDFEQHLKSRVYRIRHADEGQILKLCAFSYQMPYMTRELVTYKRLQEQRCRLVPTLRAYVYEGSEDRIIGFICEELLGRFAAPSDLKECEFALTQLHNLGLAHGDLNNFNIIMTSSGPRFFDLELAVLDGGDTTTEELQRLQQKELENLPQSLLNEEKWGKGWI